MNSDDSDLEHLLTLWAGWMRRNFTELPDGYAPTCSGFKDCASNYAVSENDAEDYWEVHVLPSILQAVDAAIDSLPADHKRAIWWKYGLTRIEPRNAPIAFGEAFIVVKQLVLNRVAIAV